MYFHYVCPFHCKRCKIIFLSIGLLLHCHLVFGFVYSLWNITQIHSEMYFKTYCKITSLYCHMMRCILSKIQIHVCIRYHTKAARNVHEFSSAWISYYAECSRILLFFLLGCCSLCWWNFLQHPNYKKNHNTLLECLIRFLLLANDRIHAFNCIHVLLAEKTFLWHFKL